MDKLAAYSIERLDGKYSPFYEWVLTTYLPKEIFPI